MPFYEFKCEECGTEFEEHFDVDENQDNVVCPDCQSRNVKRDFSSVAFGGRGGCSTSKKEKENKGSSCGHIRRG
jgi:putative FmdB family regulatory protein